VPAAGKYVRGDWNNPKIHDTHLSSNPGLLSLYPEDLENSGPIELAVNTMVAGVIKNLRPNIKAYPEAPVSYDIFGVDVMITADYKAKLLECNRFPSFGIPHDNPRLSLDNWSKELFDTVLTTAYSTTFKCNAGRPELVTELNIN
jgi:hypothetical protein